MTIASTCVAKDTRLAPGRTPEDIAAAIEEHLMVALESAPAGNLRVTSRSLLQAAMNSAPVPPSTVE